jgi:co-chaperonin GroES (HSP10)
MYELTNKIDYDYSNLDEAFPPCDPGLAPSGNRVVVQLRTPKKMTKGGIVLPTDVRETEFWIAQTAKVLAVGPVAFRDRKTLELWPEGAWCAAGDYVRVPKQGGDRWVIELEDGDQALIVVFSDLDVIGKVTGDPTKMRAYV